MARFAEKFPYFLAPKKSESFPSGLLACLAILIRGIFIVVVVQSGEGV